MQLFIIWCTSLEIQKDEEKGLKVIGAIYRIEDGTVEFDV